jgi:hypothetical protein
MTTPRYDLSDQKIAQRLFWWYKKARNELFPFTRGGREAALSADEEDMVWGQVAFKMRDRFPGESDERLDNILLRTRKAVENMYEPAVVKTGRTIDEIAADSSRHPR